MRQKSHLSDQTEGKGNRYREEGSIMDGSPAAPLARKPSRAGRCRSAFSGPRGTIRQEPHILGALSEREQYRCHHG